MLAVSWRSKELDYSTAAESRAIVLVQREKKFLLHFFFFYATCLTGSVKWLLIGSPFHERQLASCRLAVYQSEKRERALVGLQSVLAGNLLHRSLPEAH